MITTLSRQEVKKKLITWITLIIFNTQPMLAAAQTIADPNAPNQHRPTIEAAQNGVPVVQITTPSAAGVSRNLYQQLNVGSNGLIFNNSNVIAQTQLAGYIAGNPNLASGTARIVLNEVTGTNVSQLRGYAEIAGSKAALVIANPNGIVGEGFGFINANRVVLTTGTPVFGGSGSLDAFRVTGGQITISGTGMDANQSDRVDLISRAVTVNAGMWAKELNVVTGANQVEYANLHTQTITGDGVQPLVAVDVGALGGMYANKIKLVGTERGVGVNSLGTIAASNGDLTLTQEGKIVLAGTTSAAGSVQMNTQDSIANTGTVYAQNNIELTSAGAIENSGLIAAAKHTDLTAQSVSSTGTLGAGVNTAGTVTATGNLTITTSGSILARGRNVAGGNLAMNASGIDLIGANTYAGNKADLTATSGTIDNTGGTLQVADALTITASGAVKNDKSLSSVAGEINAGQLSIQADSISNKGGKLTQYGTGATTLRTVNGIDNTGGQIATNGSSLSINASSLTNRAQGSITADGSATITVSANIDNSQGIVETKKGLTVSAQSLTNQGGRIASLDNSGLVLTTTGDIQNDTGSIGGNGQVSVSAKKISNVAGKVTANDNLTLTTAEGINNTQGQLSAGHDLTVTQSAAAINNSQGVVGAGRTLTVAATEVGNTGGKMSSGENAALTIAKISGAGEVVAGQNLTINAIGTFTNETGSQLKANQDISVTANGGITNQGTLESVRNISVSGSGVTNEAGAAMTANKALTITATGDIQNRGDMIGNKVNLTANRIANEGNKALIGAVDLSGADTDPTKKAEINLYAATSVENKDDASIYSQGNLNIAGSAAKDGNGQFTTKTGNVLNQSASIEADGDIVISANELTNKLRAYTVSETNISETRYDQVGVYTDPDYPNVYGLKLGETTAIRLTTGNNWDIPAIWLLAETVLETVIAPNSSRGKLISGRNMFLDVPFINNEYSLIIANGSLTKPLGGIVNNLAVENQRITRRQLVYADTYAYTIDREMHLSGREEYSELARSFFHHYANAVYPGHIGEGYTDTITEQLPGGIPAIFSGNQQVTIQGTVNNSVVAPGSVAGTNHALLPSASTGPISNPQTNHGGTITLPQNGMYTVHTEPTAKYLVETNPRFASYQNFISSDYMLQQLNLDPASTMKRLGDGYYEQKLVREQITNLTGRVYLPGYDSADTQYKALLENGATYAKAFNLQVGIALTAAQMAQLTSDMVWLVEQEVNGQKVLVPVVYMSQINATNLRSDGAVITGDRVTITGVAVNNSGTIKATQEVKIHTNNVNNIGGTINGGQNTQITAAEDITNISGTIAGNNVNLSAGRDIKSETYTATTELPFLLRTSAGNTATITAGQNLVIEAGRDISANGTNLKAGTDVTVDAGRDLTIGSVQTQERMTTGSRYLKDSITNVTSSLEAGGNINLQSQGDTALKGAKASAGNELNLQAGGDVLISAVKDSATSDVTVGSRKNWTRTMTSDETVIGSDLSAKGKVNINTPGSLVMEGSSVTSENSGVTVTADQGVTIKEVTEKHESLVQTHRKKRGFASSKTTDTLDYTIVNQVKGSTISGDTTTVTSGTDLTVSGSNIVGTNDVKLNAQNDINISSAKETGSSTHYRQVKTSGLFSGGGLGFTIGSKSEKTTLNEQTIGEVGSTIGSINGNVTVNADNKVSSKGTSFVSGQDIAITGKDVAIDNSVNTYDSQYQYQFKQSGLTVSLGGGVIDTGLSAYNNIQRSTDVQDDRLKALYEYKAVKDLQDLNKNLDGNFSKDNLEKDVSINISIGSSKATSEQTTHVETVNASNVTAGGNVSIKATDKDISLKGTNINAQDITLEAKNNINIESAQNTMQSDSKTSSSSWSVGASFDLSSGNFGGFTGSFSKGSGKENENSATHTESIINATDTLTLKSGNDTNIIGSQASGDKVVADIGGNLNIASTQDTADYSASNKSSGIGFGTKSNSGVTGSISNSKTNSTYSSVVEQAGIYAGQEGFDITVGKNTDLKGAVIASEATPDKNKLSTDTLTYGDIQNKAEFDANGNGISLSTQLVKDGKVNTEGNNAYKIGTDGTANGTTQSAIAPGTIEIRSPENQTQDVDGLSRDTQGANGSITPIFDKEKVNEELEFQKVLTEEIKKELGKIIADAILTKKINNDKDINNQQQLREKGEITLAGTNGEKIVITGNENDAQYVEQIKACADELIATFLQLPSAQSVITTAGGVAVAISFANGSYRFEIKNIYDSIKQSPKYPNGFNSIQNGTQKYNVNNQELLSKLRNIEPGNWKKVYRDGFDAQGNKVSIHYFESKSGKVFDVDVKSGWSNQ